MKDSYWTAAQRQRLERALTHTREAALYRRALALLLVDQGRSVTEVAQWLHVDRSSIHRWIQQFAAGHNVAALKDHRGQIHPPHRSEAVASLLESALAQPPVQLGYPANNWTVPLLQAFLAVYHPGPALSLSTLRRHMKAVGYVWKRFRYVLPPDPEEEKKTPDFAANTGFARPHRAPGAGRNGPPALSAVASGLGSLRASRNSAHLRV
jgi:transposase